MPWRDDLASYQADPALAQLLGQAIDGLLQADRHLLDVDVHERTITARLADHLRPLCAGWDVDPEYNRVGKVVKRANGEIVVPDIIVHHRDTPDNHLVIEVKKSNSEVADQVDIAKLRAFKTEPRLRYTHALFIKFQIATPARPATRGRREIPAIPAGISRVVWV